MIFFIAILGACVGSFIAAEVSQIDKNRPILTRSRCDACSQKLSFWMLIPIFSFIFLRARCHFCGAKIALEAFLWEIFGAVAFGLFWWLGFDISFCLASAVLAMLARIDWQFCAVPLGWSLIALMLCVWAGARYLGLTDALNAALIFAGGAAILRQLGALWVRFRRVADEAMGEGDILIFAGLGALLGVRAGLIAVLLAALIQLLAHLIAKRREIAFAPAIIVATEVGAVFRAEFERLAFVMWGV